MSILIWTCFLIHVSDGRTTIPVVVDCFIEPGRGGLGDKKWILDSLQQAGSLVWTVSHALYAVPCLLPLWP